MMAKVSIQKYVADADVTSAGNDENAVEVVIVEAVAEEAPINAATLAEMAIGSAALKKFASDSAAE